MKFPEEIREDLTDLLAQLDAGVIHGFKKTTEQTAKHDIELAKKRLKEVL